MRSLREYDKGKDFSMTLIITVPPVLKVERLD